MDRRTRVGQIRTPPRASSAGRERISLTSPISPSPWRLIVFVSAAVRVSVPALRGLKTPSAAPGGSWRECLSTFGPAAKANNDRCRLCCAAAERVRRFPRPARNRKRCRINVGTHVSIRRVAPRAQKSDHSGRARRPDFRLIGGKFDRIRIRQGARSPQRHPPVLRTRRRGCTC